MNLTISLLFFLVFSINSFADNYDEAKSGQLRYQICRFKAENLNEINMLIVDPQVDVNYGSYESPIICAAYKLPKEFQHEVLKALLARADINLKFITSTNPLTLLMNRYPSEADPKAIDLLMADQRFDPNMPPNWDNQIDPNYPLAVVLRKGTLEQAKFLLSYGRINPNGVDVIPVGKNSITRTALYVAATSKINAIEKMHLLKERSEFILNPVGWYDLTVLMELARNNAVPQEVFETLVTDFDHDVNQVTPEGHSALFFASSPVAMRFLLSLPNTDLNTKDQRGRSALYAHLRTHDETAALLAASPRINLGTAESYEDRNAENPIADAAWFGSPKTLEVLLNRPESSAMLNHGEVLNAIKTKPHDILRRLIQDPRVNINFNKRVDPGWDSPPMVRPLFYALAERSAEAIKILATRSDLDLDFEKAENAEHLLAAMDRGNQLVGGGYREDGGARCKEPYLQEFLKAFEALRTLPKVNINYRCNQLLEDLANQDCIVSPLQIEALISDSRFQYSPSCKFSDSDGKLKKRDLHFNIARKAELIGLETVFKYFPPSPNLRDEEGNTLLMAVLSSRSWRPPVFEYVFRHFGKEAINVKNNKAETPLIVAAKQHAVLAIETLLSMPEVDLCARDNEGKTAEDADNDHYHRKTGLITEEFKKRGISCKD